VKFPENLPITARVIDIANAIDANQVIIVAGETGSGKTTQLPKICLAMGRAVDGYIGCTQPRRIAATSVAARVAEELETELGDVVGYKVRFNDRIKRSSYVKFMTDGILLAEIQGDPMLRGYDTIIIDEAHERSLNIDFLLGFLKQLVPVRPELRVIVSSATLETERFAMFFGGAPVIEVSGRTYPVDVLYRPPREDEADLADAVANTVNEITELDPRGDVLVFLPGEREIRESVSELEQRALPHTVVLPLYARLSAAEQQRVFQLLPQRRVVLATNVAETSLTIAAAAEGGAGDQRRRDLAHDPGDRVRRRRGGRPREPVQRADGRHAAPRRAGVEGERRSAQGPLRAHRQRGVLPALRGAGLHRATRAHRSGDQAGRARRRDPAHEGAPPRRHRDVPVPRPAPEAGRR